MYTFENYPTPKTEKQLRAFIFKANQFRKFIPAFEDYIKIIILSSSTRSDPLLWTQELQTVYDSLLSKLIFVSNFLSINKIIHM